MANEENGKTVSRRDLLKGALATGGAIAASSILPEKWIKPLIRGGVLPAHAQTSIATATPRPTTAPPATDTPAPTATNTPTTVPTDTPTPTNTPTNTPVPAPVFQISSSVEDFTCAEGVLLSVTVSLASGSGSLDGINMKADVAYEYITASAAAPTGVTLTGVTDASGVALFSIPIASLPISLIGCAIHYYFADTINCTANCTRDATITDIGC